MIKTSYICDRCGHEQGTPTQMWRLGITLIHQDTTYWKAPEPTTKALWCRACCEQFEPLFKNAQPKENQPAPPPQLTLEDLVREIAEQVVQDATGAAP
jgi:hypothetical protein